MNEHGDGKKNSYALKIALCLMVILVVFLIYVDYYYGTIGINSIKTQFVLCVEDVLNWIYDNYTFIRNALITEENLKVIMILGTILIISKKIDFKTIISNFSKVQISDILTLEMNHKAVEMVNEEIKEEVKEINEELISKPDDKNLIEVLEKKKKKIDLTKILVNNVYILGLLTMFTEGNLRSKTISKVDIIKQQIPIEDLGKIFKYEVKPNHIKIIGINEENKDALLDIMFKIKT